MCRTPWKLPEWPNSFNQIGTCVIIDTVALQNALQAIIGAEHVRPATSADTLDGMLPQLVAAPANAEELAQLLRYATTNGLHVAPRGGGSKRAWGNPPSNLDIILETGRLNRVLEHAWGDMTAIVEAGCTVAHFQQTLAEHGQRLALDPLWPAQATIGGILATNDGGPLRVRFGGLRDQLIGVTVALADGTLAKSGGKVVKNVAGYDLPKLMTGALGTLGVIVEAIFRLYPLPLEIRDLALMPSNPQALNHALLAILDSTLAPAAIQLSVGSRSAPRLVLRFEGLPAALDTQTEQLGQICNMAVLEGNNEQWQQREAIWIGTEPAVVARASMLPAEIGRVCEQIEQLATRLKLEWELVAHGLGVGLLRLEGANDEVLLAAVTRLRSELAAHHGTLSVLASPPAVKARIEVWGDTSDALPLMQRVKDYFDPLHTLNPGRYVGRI